MRAASWTAQRHGCQLWWEEAEMRLINACAPAGALHTGGALLVRLEVPWVPHGSSPVVGIELASCLRTASDTAKAENAC